MSGCRHAAQRRGRRGRPERRARLCPGLRRRRSPCVSRVVTGP